MLRQDKEKRGDLAGGLGVPRGLGVRRVRLRKLNSPPSGSG